MENLTAVLSYMNLRRMTGILLVASTTLIWTFNHSIVRNNHLRTYEQPNHVDDRIRVINRELLRMKQQLEEESKAKTLVEYSRSASDKPMKVVLCYTAFFHEKPWGWMNGTDRFNLWENIACPYFRCKLSFDNAATFGTADAVIFHAKDLPGRIEMFRLAKQKPRYQKWIYFALESPEYNPDAKWLNNLFHWTLTYRRDSDLYSPYGYYYRVTNGVTDADKTVRQILGKKDHFVIWAASHCNLPREKFIQELLKYIKVDVYGICASFVGAKKAGDCKLDAPECNRLRKRYKFQLAFENSNCKDYITEKYWGALKMGIVPIVIGGANYSNPDLAIPGSFINALDFNTVKELADYLKYLDKDERAYSKYFEWRKIYKEVTYAPWTCQLCAALNMNTKATYIRRLSDFWSKSGQCGLTDNAVIKMIAKTQ